MKTKILIGHTPDGKEVNADLLRLIFTRLLICANSGGGKSWLIRRLCELIVQTIPVIIFDIEGEFVSLREKFDFVLVGKGGETPADCRSAKLVMLKLLELRASAVIDLSELDKAEQHRYVKLACEAAIGAPKTLWRQTAFIFDEAHEFCPENGKGESVAKSAVLAFATKGRKRQFLCIMATQRVHKLALDARAEMLNRMIGMTFEPDDLKVAASILGVSGKEDVGNFNRTMRTMPEGNFYVFGRAVCLETQQVKVGPVQTSHGIENSKHIAAAPPAPAKIRGLLPKLADLPREAEEKERTEADLRAEIRDLKAKLSAQPKPAPAAPPPKPEIVSMFVLGREERVALDRVSAALERSRQIIEQDLEHVKNMTGKLDFVKESVAKATSAKLQVVETVKQPASTKHSVVGRQSAPIVSRPQAAEGNGTLSKQLLEILAVLSQFPEGCTMGKIGLLVRKKISGGFRNYFADLRTAGLIVGQNTETMKITEAGMAHGPFPALPQGDELFKFWMAHPAFCQTERDILQVLRDRGEMTMQEIAEAVGKLVSGGFRNYFANLRTAGVIVGRNTEPMKLNPEMFA